jgi:capsular exopolysaccharide synthesis family protein
MSRIGDALKRAGAASEESSFGDLAPDPLMLTRPAPGQNGDGVGQAAAPVEPDRLTEAEQISTDDVVDVATDTAVEVATDAAVDADVMTDAALGDESLLQSVVGQSEKLVANPQLQPVAVEQYRRLAAILHHAQKERGIRRVLVASALAEEGKTLTATNLALTLSESYRKRVLLVDADLRRPGVNIAFGIAKQAGLSESLADAVPRKLSIVQLSPTLSVLPAGHPNQDPMHGLTSLRMAQILEEAATMFDWVIIDSPPVGILPDAKLLARMVDNVLLVVAAAKTPYGAIQRAADALGRDRILGVVLNRVDPDSATPGANQYYRYYTYGERPNGRGPGLLRRLIG